MNDELSRRSVDLNEVNAMFERILATLNLGVVVVDRDQTVRVWNRESEELWGVRPDEAKGMHLLNLDIGLPVEQLKGPVKACLSQEAEFLELTLDGTNRRGKPITVKVTCTQLSGPAGGEPTGVILVMEEIPSNT
jgi:two-component system CheB/CheR fusion protein